MQNRMGFFAKKLAELMDRRGLSQNHLARMTDVRQSNISRMLAGEWEPTWKTIQKIAAALQVDVGVFVDPSIEANDIEPRPTGRPRKNIGKTDR